MPGAPLEPSIFSTAMTVAATLRAHCRYEAALKWYELYFTPGDKDLRWSTCRRPPRDAGNVPTGGVNGSLPPAVPGAGPDQPNPDASPDANPAGMLRPPCCQR